VHDVLWTFVLVDWFHFSEFSLVCKSYRDFIVKAGKLLF